MDKAYTTFNWSHSKIRKQALTQFSASVNLGSSRSIFSVQYEVNIGANLNNTLSSSISYFRKDFTRFPQVRMSLTTPPKIHRASNQHDLAYIAA
jgi:hypothetical protein